MGEGVSNKVQTQDGIKSGEIRLFASEKLLDGFMQRAGLCQTHPLL